MRHHLHCGNIRISVTEEDHPVEWNGAFQFGHVCVDCVVVAVIPNSLVDAEQVLCLGRVIDGDGWPYGYSVPVNVFRRENVMELTGD